VKQRPVVLALLALACGACDGGGPMNGTTTTTTTPQSAPPTVSSINPTSGRTAGGTAVTVTGSNFSSGASLIIGGAEATNESVSGSTTLTATTASREPPGRVDVAVRNPDGQTVTLPGAFTYFLVRANPGGPYTADGNRNITMNGTASIGNPFPIEHFFWNCGQNPHGKACDQDTPTPIFEYKQEGARGSADRTYTVTLRVVDTMGNSDIQTTTVRVRQTY